MKLLPFAVSVQWGEGFHYFLQYYRSREGASEAAKGHYKHLEAERKRKPTARKGAKPRVCVWSLWETIQDNTVPPVETGRS